MDFMTIGQIVNTHGVRGELKVYPLTDDMKRFRKLNKVYIDGIEKNLVWCKIQPKVVIIKLEEINTYEEAILLKDKYLDIDREMAVKLPEGRYFITDIIGCMVYDTTDKELGKISEVIYTGSNEVYWIKSPNELLIPALKTIITNIDIANKRITINPLETWQ